MLRKMTKKPYEEMSIEELQKELSRQTKKDGLRARKLKSDDDGALILNPNNPEDVEWYENDEDYNVTKEQ